MSLFKKLAADVEKTLMCASDVSTDDSLKSSSSEVDVPSKFAKTASRVFCALGGAAPPDERDPEWQRVNSSIADVLKDTGVLFSKLARLQGDFAGVERAKLEEIGNKVRDLTDELSKFSSDFYNGDLNMKVSETPFNYGGPAGGGGGQPSAPPAPPAPSPEGNSPTHSEEDFDVEAEITEEDSKLDKEYGSDDTEKEEEDKE